MNFTERDELPHIPDESDSRRWQENFFVIAWAVDDNAGVLVHCKRWPSTGKQTARIVAVIDDRVVSRRVVEAIPAEEFAIDGLRLNVKHPFRELELRGSFYGAAGFGPLGFVAWRTDGGVPATIDLTLRSELAPADFTEGFEVLAQSVQVDTTRQHPVFENTQKHYEQGGRCEGIITIAGERRRVDGLFVRDHTWGSRDETGISQAGHGFWTASVAADGDLFFNATGVVANGVTHGIGVVVDRSGQSVTTDINVEFNPQPGLHAFDSTRVRIGGSRPLDVVGHPTVHLVKYLPGSGPGRFDDNAVSRLNAPGLTGFGVHEYAGTLTPEQAALLEAAEGDR